MNFRRWVVFTFAVHVLVILLDKGAGLILFKLLEDRPELKGAADLLTTLPFIMMAVANLGLATSSVYFLRRRDFTVEAVSRTTAMVALVWGGAVAVLAIVASQTVLPLVKSNWSYDLAYVVPICLCVPLLLTTSYFNSVQLAVERIRDYNLVHLLASVSFLPLFLLAYWWLDGNVTEGVALGRLASAALVTVATLWMLRSIARWRPRIDWTFLRAGLRYGWKANLTSVLTYLNHRIDLFLVPFLFLTGAAAVAGLTPLELRDLQLREAAFYSLAVTFAELVWHFPEAMRDLFFSKVAGSSHAEARWMTPALTRLCLTAALIGAVFIYLAVDPAMALLSPSDWSSTWSGTVVPAMLLLIPGTVAFTVAKILQNDLAARGHLNHCLVACLLVLTTMLALDWLWIPQDGALGAARASSVAYVAASVYTLIAYRASGGATIRECLVVRAADWRYVTGVFAAVWSKIRGGGRR
jgi:O-antigen/teichoic acid export membrane protein